MLKKNVILKFFYQLDVIKSRAAGRCREAAPGQREAGRQGGVVRPCGTAGCDTGCGAAGT